MRFALLFLPWCFLPLALADSCNWKMPTTETSCTQDIKWKVYDNNQATATCLEYFPTTFLEGTKNDNTPKPPSITCTVDRQFQCDFLDVGIGNDASKAHLKAVPMFDKCYRFLDNEFTMKDYMAKRDTNEDLCKDGGGLPIFFTPTQGKHIGKEAHRRGIFKMWANVGSDGKTVDKSYVLGGKEGQDAGFLLYKNLWKVHDATYWQGDTLKKTPAGGDPNAKFLFFRANTDYPKNLWQGSFELATEDAKAHVVCEYPAKIVPNQKKYCEKMGALGMKVKYDHREVTNTKRCLYASLTKYPMKGTKEAIRDFPGCKEKPSDDQVTGLDDGTASKEVYDALTEKGTYRIAAIKGDLTTTDQANNEWMSDLRKKCDGRSPSTKQRSAYNIFDHFSKKDFAASITSLWDPAYPKYECSDFPAGDSGDSNTLAIRKGQIIDVPVPVRLPAICSIASMVDCGLHSNVCDNLKTPGGKPRTGLLCENIDTWNEETKMYATCKCAAHHTENSEGVCAWNRASSKCAYVRQYHAQGQGNWADVGMGDWMPTQQATGVTGFEDAIDRVVVRNGCTIRIYSHPQSRYTPGQMTLLKATYGEHVVPNHAAGTLNGYDWGMSASAIDCKCDYDAPVYSG